MAGMCLGDRDCGPRHLHGRKGRLERHTPSPIGKSKSSMIEANTLFSYKPFCHFTILANFL